MRNKVIVVEYKDSNVITKMYIQCVWDLVVMQQESWAVGSLIRRGNG